MQTLTKGSTAWYDNRDNKDFLLNKQDPFYLVSVLSINTKKGECEIKFLTRKRKDERVKIDKVIPLTNEATINNYDLLKYENMTELDIFNNFKNRFSKKDCLSNIGPLLISVNPYQNLYSFSLEKMRDVMNLSRENKLNKIEDASAFITFAKCLHNLFINKNNQLLILNGETGSGKTTILRYFYQYLIYEIKANNLKTQVDERLLYAQTILEAFGNCKTTRNDNSTRFNNSISIYLDTNTRQIQGVRYEIIHFDKYRIHECPDEERLFHIFYQLPKGGGAKLLETLLLSSDLITFKYLSVTKSLVADTIKDEMMFRETENALRKIGFSEKEILNIYKIIAAILFLGNVNFKDSKGAVIIEDKNGPFTKVCKLLEISPEFLESSLNTSVKIVNDKPIKTALKAAECNQYRNMLASDLYYRLFNWIVNKINLLMTPNKSNEMQNPYGIIEVYDSIGFETNLNNNFDNLVSNYLSEKLFNLLLNDMIKKELLFLEKEGANVDEFTYKDNSSILELFEKPSAGIINTIDEFSLSNADDKAFFTKLSKLYPNNPLFKISNSTWKFSISHSSRETEYNSFGCVTKNLDWIKPELIECMGDSKNLGFKSIYMNLMTELEIKKQISGNDDKKNSSTKNPENFYFQKIKRCWELFYSRTKDFESHHILCFNSNNLKKKETLMKNMLFSNIKSYNLNDIVRARKEYQIRIPYEEFFFMFEDVCNWEGKKKVMEYKENKNNYDFKELALKCLKIIDPNKNNDIVFGKNLLLIRSITFTKLVKFLNSKLAIKLNSILKLQNKYRKWQNRKKHLFIRSKVIKIQSMFRVLRMRTLLKKQRKNISIIQGRIRAKISQRSIFILKRCANKIQQYVRMMRAKVFLQKMKKSGEFIARKMKQFLIVCRKKRKERIMKTYFNYIFDKAIELIKSKVKVVYSIIIQKHLRGLLTKIKYFDIIKKARARRSIYNYEKSSYIIQRNYRGFIVRLKRHRYADSSFFLQKWWRMTKVNLMIRRMRKSCIKVQKNLRIYFNMKKLISKILNNFFKNEYPSLNDVFNKSKNCIFPNFGLAQDPSPKRELHFSNYGSNGHNTMLEEIQNKKKIEMSYKGILPEGLDYIEPKMLLFAKVLDIDFIISSEEIYDKGWAEEYEKIYNYNIANGTPIQQIKVGSFHSMAINNKGALFSWGWNNYGQCGLSVSTNSDKNAIPNISRDKNNKLERIPTNYYLKSGKIAFRNQTERFGQIRQVVCSEESSFIIDNNNNLYACGKNSRGQLGLGHSNPVSGFTLIGDLKGQVKLFSSNGEMNFAQTFEDEVYLWENESKLTKLVMKKVNIVSVACGEKFSLILSQQGVVFSFGKCNKFGQLGNGNRIPRYTPEPVSDLINIGEKVSQISCGYKHCVVKCTSGKAFSWGLNSEGQLGIGTLRESTLPRLITLDNIYPTRVNILQVACSFRATFLLTEYRTILVCGTFNDFTREKLPVKFNLKFKHPEIADESSYSSVKIVSSWNKSFSIFYSILADIRDMNKKIVNRLKVNMILNSIAGKWETDTMEPPYIESLSGYFTSNCMKKPDNRRERNGSQEKNFNRKKSV